MRLLFVCAHWHGLAKLRMHTDQTLNIFDETTIRIGVQFRAFSDKTCPAFDTHELSRETQARQRRQAKIAAEKHRPVLRAEPVGTAPVVDGTVAGQGLTSHPGLVATTSPNVRGPRQKKFNLRTYKYHSLGDYPKTIRQFGTTDSYSTEPVGSSSRCQ
jgi:hypothetical protein